MTTKDTSKVLSIEVAKGWKDGTQVVFKGEGDQGPFKLPGILDIF